MSYYNSFIGHQWVLKNRYTGEYFRRRDAVKIEPRFNSNVVFFTSRNVARKVKKMHTKNPNDWMVMKMFIRAWEV